MNKSLKPLSFEVFYESKPNKDITDAKGLLINHLWNGEKTGSLEITPFYIRLDVLDYSYSETDPKRMSALNQMLEDGFAVIIGDSAVSKAISGWTKQCNTRNELCRAKALMNAYKKYHPDDVELINLGYERTYEAQLERELDNQEKQKTYSTKRYGRTN